MNGTTALGAILGIIPPGLNPAECPERLRLPQLVDDLLQIVERFHVPLGTLPFSQCAGMPARLSPAPAAACVGIGLAEVFALLNPGYTLQWPRGDRGKT